MLFTFLQKYPRVLGSVILHFIRMIAGNCVSVFVQGIFERLPTHFDIILSETINVCPFNSCSRSTVSIRNP